MFPSYTHIAHAVVQLKLVKLGKTRGYVRFSFSLWLKQSFRGYTYNKQEIEKVWKATIWEFYNTYKVCLAGFSFNTYCSSTLIHVVL